MTPPTKAQPVRCLDGDDMPATVRAYARSDTKAVLIKVGFGDGARFVQLEPWQVRQLVGQLIDAHNLTRHEARRRVGGPYRFPSERAS